MKLVFLTIKSQVPEGTRARLLTALKSHEAVLLTQIRSAELYKSERLPSLKDELVETVSLMHFFDNINNVEEGT